MPADALDATLQNAMQNFVKTALGYAGGKVIWDKQDSNRPAVPYAMLSVSSGPRPLGPAEVRSKVAVDTFTFPFRKEITLTVNVYADSGWLSLLATISNALELPSIKSILRLAGIAIIRVEDPIEISELLNDQWEGRGSIDIILAYNQQVDDVPGEIQSVEFDGTLGTFEVNQTIP